MLVYIHYSHENQTDLHRNQTKEHAFLPHMASSSSLSYPKHRNSCALGLFILFIFCLFFFSRRLIEIQIPIYRDLTPQQTPLSIPSPVRSTEKFDDSAYPVLSASDPVDDVDGGNSTSSEFQEESNNEGATVETSSESDENAEKPTAPVVLPSNPESEENSGETTDEPLSLDDKNDVPISSKSDLDNEAALSDTEKSEGFVDNVMAEKWRNCDFYHGSWVRDEGYPLYQAGSCPYIDDGFECTNNGRPDSEYLKWRWKPDGCDLPRFNATDFLVRLKGKKLLLVGDSMNRNQFESLLCLLREGLPDKSRMYEVHGYKITKGRGYFVFKFEDYNCTVEFVRSHFLVREGVRINAQGNSNPTLSIDRIDKTARRWQRADILVFNTGHWWTHGKTSRGKNYYKEGDYLYPHFDAVEAYKKAIKTWAIWVKRNLPKQLVFYRGYSSAHFRGGDWDSGGSCNGETEPVKSGPIIDSYPTKMRIVEEVLRETRAPVVLLNVTRLTNFRKDGHPSVFGRNVTGGKKVSTRRQDCSHWCLPGVPDAWNELIYSTLVARQI